MKKSTIVVVLALAGCSSTPSGHQAGNGEVIRGVQVWNDGPPPRPYQVIATVQRQGADGTATLGDQESSIADEAAQRGADAVIVLDHVMVVARLDPVNGRPIMAVKVDAELIKYQ